MSLTNLLLGNWYGQLSSSSSKTPELSQFQKDNGYSIQCHEPIPWLLINNIFHVAQVVESDYLSKEVHRHLIKLELLTPDGEVRIEVTERPNFGKNIMSKLAYIPAVKIKQTVIFLFWWAEETQRLKKLVAERAELKTILEATPDATDEQGIPVHQLLEHVTGRILAKPSDRQSFEAVQNVWPSAARIDPAEPPPPYTRRA